MITLLNLNMSNLCSVQFLGQTLVFITKYSGFEMNLDKGRRPPVILFCIFDESQSQSVISDSRQGFTLSNDNTIFVKENQFSRYP